MQEEPMQTLMLVALMVLTMAAVVSAEAATYRAPAHNYYQNNWMSR
jgi:hypothetical protein